MSHFLEHFLFESSRSKVSLTTFVSLCVNSRDSRCRFQATLGHCCLFQNDTATRSFVGMCVSDGVSRVIDLIHSIDNVLRERGLETYYEPAKPHVSIGWSVSALPASLDKWSYIPDAVVPFTIDQVFVQSGIKTYPCKMI
eukprot:c8849_g1_i3.p1 GENE.c8849_g1_i3~~c8849_g1_i3.p1  ORF type:complete len:140 (-),score=35.23 c8849_g1_i3:33-452(-)